jgi:GntR family transcriptional regulator, transcriptional repressor for pyruvate dehydrogenase complex
MPVKTIQPIHKRQISKATIDRLLSMIKDGYWAPGERLPPQRELAESLSIGMSTLREALQSLQTMGILEVRHGDGTYVSDRVNDRFENSLSMSLAMGELDLQMLFEARGILEPGFAYFAANRATKEQVEKLFEILEDERIEIENQRSEKLHALDQEFHRLVAEMAANKFLQQIDGTMLKALDELLQNLPLTLKGWKLHREVASEIREHNPFKASEAMRTLIEASAARYVPIMFKVKKKKNGALTT